MNEEDLKRVEAAINNVDAGEKGYTSLPLHIIRDKIMAELRKPEHEFREGEVVVYKYPEEDAKTYGLSDKEYFETWIDDKSDIASHFRPLRLSEMPQAVEDLREACFCILNSIADSDDKAYLKQALADFDARVE